MCGIAGYWNGGSGEPASRRIIEAMARTLLHRGPDEEGYWVRGTVALGMRRLQVVDPEGGHQPMPNEDGEVQVIFNGEIYNHAELRRDLERRGHRFRTRSDTEVIVHAFEEWGPACVERFNGMFAIAVWDARTRRLFIARDRLGIKPLYVYHGPDGVVFGSELKAVVAHPSVPMEWDLEAVDDFMTYEFVPAPRTIIRGVGKLPAGTWMCWNADRPDVAEVRRYWRPSATAHPASAEESALGLRELMRRSVRRRLMADVPLGAFLSGGIDSSVIVGLMSEETPGNVRSFSLGFEDRSYDELEYAELVAAHHATTHRSELVRPQIVDLAERLAGLFDEPFADVSAFPTYMLSALARKDVTVALSGDGGDELFAGYDHYRAHRWAARISWLSRTSPWTLVERLIDGMPPAPEKKGAVNKAKRFVEGLRRPADLEHARWWVFWDLAQRRSMYSAEAAAALRGRDCFAYYRARLDDATDAGFRGLQRQLYSDVTGYLADDILTKVDRMSMGVSLEARVPFLDHEMVEYAMGIPAEFKLHGGQTKWILKEAFRDTLPATIRRRRKEGFSMPMKHWLRGPLRPMMEELLAPRRMRSRGWFEPAEVARLVDEHGRGRENHAHRIWCLMALELSLDGLARRVAGRPRVEQEILT